MSYLKHSSALLLLALLPAAAVAQAGGPKPAPKPAMAATHKPATPKPAATKPATPKLTEATPGLLAKATVPAEAAEQSALALVPGGAVTKGSIADLKGVLTYTFEVKGTAGMKKVMVDAKTGAATLAVTKPAGKPGAKPKTGGTKPGGG